MHYRTIPPSPALAGFVRFFWVLEGAPDGIYHHRTLADGCAEMVFHYQGRFDEWYGTGTEKSFTSGIHGQSNRFRRFSVGEAFGIFGVYLYPYAVPLLIRQPASDLTNEMPDLGSVFGREGRELEERMMLAVDTDQRIAIVSSFLTKRFREKASQPGVFSCIRSVIETRGMTRIELLADACSLSQRQFSRKFHEYAGFSPKLFSRIIRFQSAIAHPETFESLTELAYRCGYYDQSHFIHDFREFSGFHPGHFFFRENEATGWMGW